LPVAAERPVAARCLSAFWIVVRKSLPVAKSLIRARGRLRCGPAAGCGLSQLSPKSSVAVVSAEARGESRSSADARRFRAPAPSAGGGRTHSPGAADPSLVWLPISLGNLTYIFGKNQKEWSELRIKGLEGKKGDWLLDSEDGRAPV
jgi:hypothetical protein